MNYTIDPNTFASHWDSTLARTYGIYAEFLLYGILLVLLCIAGHFLYHWTGAGRKSLALATSAMAILATLQIIIHVYIAVLGSHIVRLAIEGAVWPAPLALGPTNLYDRLYVAKDFLLVTNNIVTDGLFIYRCFVVWGRNIRIVFLPMLMLFATTVLGYLVACEDEFISPNQLDPRVPIAITILTSMVLMGLTGEFSPFLSVLLTPYPPFCQRVGSGGSAATLVSYSSQCTYTGTIPPSPSCTSLIHTSSTKHPT
ncbi:hypothetical protein B0H13DRAFT_1986859 [Mycena leptocephala]|nr:hypothetical protein B0H13DRAFT_1986859 [Mycena leptocephala]